MIRPARTAQERVRVGAVGAVEPVAPVGRTQVAGGGATVAHQSLVTVASALHDERARRLVLEDRRTGRAPLEMRSAATADVTTYNRTIEIVAAPAEQPADVIIDGRMVEERFARGAFAGCELGTRRVPVNRDHVMERLCGKAVHLDPHHHRGLIATLKIAPTPLGDETLALAADDCLDASVGFRVPTGGVTWNPGRTERHVTRALLDHIALTSQPAYQSANVLALRGYR